MNDNDTQLLLAMNRGDHAAAETLWERFSPRLLAYARVLLKGDDAAATDAVQSVFFRIITCDPTVLLGVREVLPWLLGLTRHKVIDSLRARRRGSVRLVRLAHERRHFLRRSAASSGSGASDPRLERALDAIDLLPRRSAEVIMLRHAAGLTFEQMGLALQCNAHSIASRYRRAIAQLRILLDVPQTCLTAECPRGATP